MNEGIELKVREDYLDDNDNDVDEYEDDDTSAEYGFRDEDLDDDEASDDDADLYRPQPLSQRSRYSCCSGKWKLFGMAIVLMTVFLVLGVVIVGTSSRSSGQEDEGRLQDQSSSSGQESTSTGMFDENNFMPIRNKIHDQPPPSSGEGPSGTGPPKAQHASNPGLPASQTQTNPKNPNSFGNGGKNINKEKKNEKQHLRPNHQRPGGGGGGGGGGAGHGIFQGGGKAQAGNNHPNKYYDAMRPPPEVSTSSDCELEQHRDWLEAIITKEDGKMYEIVEQLDHDHSAFVQGLTYAEGKLWESNGLYGESTVRILDPKTAKVLKSVDMDPTLFGEGMAYHDGKLYQITWKSNKGFIYNATTLELMEEYEFHTTNNQGWGITWDPCQSEFVVTDGSPNLHFWDKVTLQETRKTGVTRMDGTPAQNLNEIEWYRGRILANVWFEDVLLVIDPATGKVEKEYDFRDLFPKDERKQLGSDVFNGISVSEDPDIIYVTGKKWDRMFEVRLLP